jgi:hypothetical protein
MCKSQETNLRRSKSPRLDTICQISSKSNNSVENKVIRSESNSQKSFRISSLNLCPNIVDWNRPHCLDNIHSSRRWTTMCGHRLRSSEPICQGCPTGRLPIDFKSIATSTPSSVWISSYTPNYSKLLDQSRVSHSIARLYWKFKSIFLWKGWVPQLYVFFYIYKIINNHKC